MQAMPYKDETEFGGTRPHNESFLELSHSVRGLLTDEEVDTLFARDPSVSRPLDRS